jgi:hypothetical protein
LVEAVAIIV